MEINIPKTEKNEKEILEMILQFCYENKYFQTAKLIESKTNIIYDQNEIQELKYLLKEHEFDKSIQFLEKSNFENLQKTEVMKIIKSRKLIELIKNANFESALEYIRKEICPLINNFQILNKFSPMLFIKEKEYLERYLRQNFSEIAVDDTLIVKVQNLLCLSLDSNGNRILPNSRLENLLTKYYKIIESEKIKNEKLKDFGDFEGKGYGNHEAAEMEIEMNIENIIDKNINEVYDTLERYNHFDIDPSKSLNDSLSNNDSMISYENYYINKSNFTFDQIYSLEKIEDEIWYMEFTPSNTFFATCTRNGIVSIFKLEINTNNFNTKENVEMTVEQENKPKNGFSKESNLINLENVLTNSNRHKSSENSLISLKIKCVNNFLAHKKSVTALSWSKNEKHLLTSSTNKEVFLWDPFDGTMIKRFQTHNDIVSCVKWITNDTFVSGSIDKRMRIEHIDKGLVCSETFSRIRKILISEFYSCIIILPSSMNDIVFYDYKNFREVNRLTEMDPIISGNISKKDEGRHLIVNLSKVNASINLYEISNLKLINKFYGHSQEQYSIECSFAGEYDEFIMCGSEDANIYIWHITDSIPIRIIKGHTGCINACNLIKILDKNVIFSASDDHTVRVWGAKDINVEFSDVSGNASNRKKSSFRGRSSLFSNHNNFNQPNAIFDVVDMSNWGVHNNDVSPNDESREESSDYYVEEDE